MEKCPVFFMALLAALACSRLESDDPYASLGLTYGKNLSHDEICLGGKLENPYKTINIQKACESLYPTRARVPVETTDLYVRFLPADDEEFAALEALGLDLVDHPVDYEIIRDGDWYHDPTLPEEAITWQYSLVPKDFDFPDIRYEILDECYLHEHAASTKAAEGVDWAEVERRAYEISGNASLLAPRTRSGEESVPSGRITLIDPDADGGKPVGVEGVRIFCNSFIRFDTAVTDRDGWYSMKKGFSSEVNYRMVFKNDAGFSIGFNLLLVPASVSTLGKAGPEGVNMTVTSDSEHKLYTRCVVNKAARDYIRRCGEDDMDLVAPPDDIRIWIFNKLNASSCIMMHHGAVIDQGRIAAFLGSWSVLVKIFAPDITVGTAAADSFSDIYSTTTHEMAHSSHYAQAGNGFWDDYIYYILESFVRQGDCYGDGNSEMAGLCELGEGWAYHIESKIYQQRYGGAYPSFGCGYWFKPQIFRYLDERGISPSEQLEAMEEDVRTRDAFRDRLMQMYPSRRRVVEQVFNRYN